jgi:hypothetical protein
VLPLVAAMAAVAAAARRFLMLPGEAATAAGSIVMAIGIFGVAPLQQMPTLRADVTQPLAIGLFVVWSFIAASYLGSLRQGTFGRHVDPPIGRFAIGSWVAATAVLMKLLLLGTPDWRGLAALLGLLAGAMWVWFLALAARAARSVVRSSSRALVPGVVLLSTVSTQSLALAALDLAPDRQAFQAAADGLIALGALFYLVGVAVIVRSHVRTAGWTLAEDWDNSNCILHGAMSITGLAVVSWNPASPALALAIWVYVLCVFVGVEAIEVARLLARCRTHGWGAGVFRYGVSQWARNFTFGMFYAFTLALAQQRQELADPGWLRAIWAWILAYGAYPIIALLLVEAALLLSHRLDRGALAAIFGFRREGGVG